MKRNVFARAISLLVLASLLAACAPQSATLVAAPTQAFTPTTDPTRSSVPYTAPNWFKNAILYEIYVRSFYDSDGDGMGDLRGVQEKLDYLKDLGVEALWLMPIYPSPSVHGYDVTDFYAVNPDYGTLADLVALTEAAHARGLRILLDFVPSHLSDQNPLFAEAYNNPASVHSDWFAFTNENHTRYASFAENLDMPRFNHYNPEVMAYLTDAALFWLAQGIDGFRVDNVTFPPKAFFVSFRQSIKSAYPDALLLGEAWVTDPRSLSIYYPDQFDALFDFPLYNLIEGLPNGPGDGLLNGRSSTSLVTILFTEHASRYPAESLSLRFLSNHDTDRIASETRGDPQRERLAASLLAGLPGPLMLYYGEEIGMLGRKGTAPYWDNYRRAPMDWYADEEGPGQATWFMVGDRWNAPLDGISVEEEESDSTSLLNYYRKVFDLHENTPALQSDLITFPGADWSGQGGLALLRGEGRQTLLALYNFSDETLKLSLSSFPLESAKLFDLLTNTPFTGPEAGRPYEIQIPARSALWLVALP